MATTAVAYSRVLLKLSGEALAGDKGLVFDFDRVNRFCDEVKEVADMGVSVGLVIGGGGAVGAGPGCRPGVGQWDPRGGLGAADVGIVLS